MNQRLTIFRGSILTPVRGGEVAYHEDAYLAVTKQGRILGISATNPEGRGKAHDLRGHLMVPGFVDTHLHYPQTRVIGSATGPLLEWLDRTVFPEEERFLDSDYATRVAAQFCRAALSHGTTTVGAYSSSSRSATDVLFGALEAAGLRAVAGQVLMDQNCPDALRVPVARAIEECGELVARWHNSAEGRLRVAVIPRFAISCSRPMLESAARFARDNQLHVMTHIAENPREGSETLEYHPFAKDYLGVYEAVGLVHERTVLAHAIHLTESEWDRLGQAGASLAHCPDSNFFLGSGAMPLREADARSIRVGLGTDVAAGRSFDMRRSMGHAHDAALLTGSSASPERLFVMATQGGADVLGLADETGSLEPGKAADFVVLRRPEGSEGREAALRIATFAGDLSAVSRVYVDGKRVYSAGLVAVEA